MNVFSTLGDFLQVEKMKDFEEQRVCAKFCLKLGKTFTETFQILQHAYGEDCLSRTPCHEFRIGQNVHRRRPQIWTAFHVNGRHSR